MSKGSEGKASQEYLKSTGLGDPYELQHDEEVLTNYINKNNMRDNNLLDQSELLIQADMELRKSSLVEKMKSRLHRNNMEITHRMFVCMRKCMRSEGDVSERELQEERTCIERCRRSEDRYQTFVKKITERDSNKFMECLTVSQNSDMMVLLRCYNEYFKSIDLSLGLIDKELSYYNP